jgi:hypothetical protein
MHSSLLDDVMFTIYHVNTAVLLVKMTGLMALDFAANLIRLGDNGPVFCIKSTQMLHFCCIAHVPSSNPLRVAVEYRLICRGRA